MIRNLLKITSLILATTVLFSCAKTSQYTMEELAEIEKKVNEFVEVDLSTDISNISVKEKEMLVYLFDAAQIMDDLFWKQNYGDKEELLSSIQEPIVQEFVKINYGPWEQLNDNKPFTKGCTARPAGANFYPIDMTKEEFESLEAEDKTSLYTVVRRDADGKLITIPYHVEYKVELVKAAELIKKAAELAEDEGLKNYLNLRAEALVTSEYFESDLAWMDMKNNTIDFVVGPIENYTDGLYGYKAAFESFILIKDMDWTVKLSKFAALLPELQTKLPVANEYKSEVPGSGSDLGVYDAVYYAGDCNAGSKTIAINLPNDERVHIEKGSRKLQLKNSMNYKFEKILKPISDIVIDESQRQYIKFDAFFENVMFHEVAHGLGIKNTINNKGTVRDALKEKYSAIEEAKADILGLFLVTKLAEMGELGEKDLKDNYTTFLAGIFRSVRFGAASSHGQSNMIQFNYFNEQEAFTRDEATGLFKVDYDKMALAVNSLGEKILVIQGNGDYEEASKLIEEMSIIKETLQGDLKRIGEAGIPRDIRFKQGKENLGLN
ncbi:MAG: Zn-dependent hydrolase [Bacteroidetes bacterium GWF2_33_16]|nr:MAG: Zn-dependent hydrolase [Bacteroidetes bacterium GWE2_32_14]OFY07248.1 MAG: Zn-dependent hydrolase [Bacteroidetes bacterium GWF2_33_16]